MTGLPTYLYGHDTWYNGDGNPYIPTVLVELEIGLRFEEELCYDEVCSSVYLLLQVLQVILVTGAVRVTMGVTCNQWKMGRE